MAKTVVGKFNFCKLKIEKVNCVSVFEVGDCLASCLSFTLFLTLDP